MQSQYEQRQDRSSHDYARVDDSYDSTSTAGTTYRSAMSPRVTNFQRARSSALGGGIGSGGGSGGVMTRVYQSFQSTGGSGSFGPGLASLANFPGVPLRGSTNTNTALVGLNTTRQRDKRDLEHLNDKFAQYVEKVRFLEAQNRKLVLELEALRSRSGQGSSRIKEMYDIETAEANRLIDDTKRDAAAANVKNQQADQEVRRQKARYNEVSSIRETDRKEIDNLQRQIAENEAQIALFRRRLADLDDEARRYKAESQRLSTEIGRLQNEIQNERFLKSSCEVEKMALDDELASLRHIHEADLADLRSQSVSNDLDPSQFFRNELSQAIREIRKDYENVVDNQRSDLQNRYSLLFNELTIRQQRPDANPLYGEQQRRQEERVRTDLLQSQNQTGYLRAQNQDTKNRIEDLQRKLAALREEGGLAQAKMAKQIEEAKQRLDRANQDFAEVSTLKTSLEKEIGTYRDLLESQNGLRGYVDRIVQNVEQQALDRPSGRSSGGGSTTVTRTTISSIGSNYGGYGSIGGYGTGGRGSTGFGTGGAGGGGAGGNRGSSGGGGGSYGTGAGGSSGGGGGGYGTGAGGSSGGGGGFGAGSGGSSSGGGYGTGGGSGGVSNLVDQSARPTGNYPSSPGGGYGTGGVNNLVAQNVRPGNNTNNSPTISSGIRNTLRDSTGSDTQTRQSGDY